MTTSEGRACPTVAEVAQTSASRSSPSTGASGRARSAPSASARVERPASPLPCSRSSLKRAKPPFERRAPVPSRQSRRRRTTGAAERRQHERERDGLGRRDEARRVDRHSDPETLVARERKRRRPPRERGENPFLRRLSPQRSPWPDVTAYDERALEPGRRAAAPNEEIAAREQALVEARKADHEALTQWQLADRTGARPEPTVPAIEQEIAAKTAERRAGRDDHRVRPTPLAPTASRARAGGHESRRASRPRVAPRRPRRLTLPYPRR
jgi:hypothetical protein